MSSSIRIFERADFGQTREIVSITDRDTNLKEEVLKEDCSGNCSQIFCWMFQKPEILSHVSALQGKKNLFKYQKRIWKQQ